MWLLIIQLYVLFLQKTYVTTKANEGVGDMVVFKSFHERVDENGRSMSALVARPPHLPFFRSHFVLG